MFSSLDWTIVAIYLVGTTWIGHALRGPQATNYDFFLGGRNVPWPAVAASSIATTISAITFVSVPALVYAADGNFTYLQLAIGGIISRLIVAYVLVPHYFSGDYYSPYDFTRHRLGLRAGQLISGLFLVGGVLGQSVRVYATALILELLTGWALAESILIITCFSIAWTWLGGIRTVIWTDVVQFFVLIGSAIFVLIYVFTALPITGLEALTNPGTQEKLTVLNFTTDPRVAFTFWAALIALPFQNVAVYGGDQLFVQRLLCCKNEQAAKKAVLLSMFGEVIPLIMLAVGLGLFVYYETFPLDPTFAPMVAEKNDRILPVFILSVLPEGVRGLIIAGLLSAAISSLDSILAALAQVSHRAAQSVWPALKDITLSRTLVLTWGIALGVIAMTYENSSMNLVDLAFTMTTYTYGPMIGLILLSIIGLNHANRTIPAVIVSVGLVAVLNHPNWLGFTIEGAVLAWPWLSPIAAITTVGVAISLDRLTTRSREP